jgi:hypothetical protein
MIEADPRYQEALGSAIQEAFAAADENVMGAKESRERRREIRRRDSN